MDDDAFWALMSVAALVFSVAVQGFACWLVGRRFRDIDG